MLKLFSTVRAAEKDMKEELQEKIQQKQVKLIKFLFYQKQELPKVICVSDPLMLRILLIF